MPGGTKYAPGLKKAHQQGIGRKLENWCTHITVLLIATFLSVLMWPYIYFTVFSVPCPVGFLTSQIYLLSITPLPVL